jgi:hypothetical protein
MNDYQLKCKVARAIEGASSHTKYDYAGFQFGYERLVSVLREVVKIECFAAKVAETVLSKMNPFSFRVAFVSKKQAWVLACAIVENNLQEMI